MGFMENGLKERKIFSEWHFLRAGYREGYSNSNYQHRSRKVYLYILINSSH